MKIACNITDAPMREKLSRYIAKHRLAFLSPSFIDCYSSDQVRVCAILNNNNDVIGCFCYYTFDKLFVKAAITPPFMPGAMLHYDNPAESPVGRASFDKDVMREVSGYLNRLGVHHIDIALPYKVHDTQPFIWDGFRSLNRYSYVLDLTVDEETLWENLSSEKRKSINKAKKENIVVGPTTDHKAALGLIRKSLSRAGKSANDRILEAILLRYASPENSITFIAAHDGSPVSAVFCVLDRESAVYLFGGLDAGASNHGAAVSCMWHAILKARELGLKKFDFEGSMHPGIERYFREFGGMLTPYPAIVRTSWWLDLLMKLKGR